MHLVELCNNPPFNDLCFQFLFRLHQLASLMKGLTTNDLLVLQYLPPVRTGDDYSDQIQFMNEVKQIFNENSSQRICELAETIQKSTQANAEHSFIKEKIPNIPFRTINLMRRIFHWSKERIIVFQRWMCSLNDSSLLVVLKIIRFSSQGLQILMTSLANIIKVNNPLAFSMNDFDGGVPALVPNIKLENNDTSNSMHDELTSSTGFSFLENISLSLSGFNWDDNLLGFDPSALSIPDIQHTPPSNNTPTTNINIHNNNPNSLPFYPPPNNNNTPNFPVQSSNFIPPLAPQNNNNNVNTTEKHGLVVK